MLQSVITVITTIASHTHAVLKFKLFPLPVVPTPFLSLLGFLSVHFNLGTVY